MPLGILPKGGGGGTTTAPHSVLGHASVSTGGSSPVSSLLATPQDPHAALLQIGAELAAVAITAVVAGTSSKAASAMVALWVLLWVLFLITYYA